jgi:hypothetical protein
MTKKRVTCRHLVGRSERDAKRGCLAKSTRRRGRRIRRGRRRKRRSTKNNEK